MKLLFCDQVLNDIETNLISDGFNLMKNNDPNDCFKRIICNIATGKTLIVSNLLSYRCLIGLRFLFRNCSYPTSFLVIGEKEYSMMLPLMNFVSDNEDQFVPTELKQFSSNLKLARQIGEAGKNIDICQGKNGSFAAL